MLNHKFMKHLIAIISGSLSGYLIVYLQAVFVKMLLMVGELVSTELLVIALNIANSVVNAIFGLITGLLILRIMAKVDRVQFCVLFLAFFILVNLILVVCSDIGIKWILVAEYLSIALSLFFSINFLSVEGSESEGSESE